MPPVFDWPWIVNDAGPLLIRTHYDKLFHVVRQCLADTSSIKHHNLLLTGNPGIGKSVGALNYLLLRTLAEQPDVVVVTIEIDCVEVFCVDQNQPSKADRRRFPVEQFTSPPLAAAWAHLVNLQRPTTTKLLLLHDQKGELLRFQGHFHSSLRRLFQVTCVLAASPKEDNYRDFMKCGPGHGGVAGDVGISMPGAFQFIMPLWTKDSTKIFVDAVFPKLAPKFDDEFKVRGGVPRNWEKVLATLICDQDIAFENERLTLSAVRGRSLRTKSSSKLLGLVPCDQYETVTSVRFVSERVEEMAYQDDARVELVEARTRYQEAIDRKRSHCVEGRLFENVAIKTVAEGWPPGAPVAVPELLEPAPFKPRVPWTATTTSPTMGDYAAAVEEYVTGTPVFMQQLVDVCGHQVGI